MRCDKVMKRDLTWVTPKDSAQRAAVLMRDGNIGFLPVCEQDGRVVGALTDRDLALRVCAEAANAAELTVADVMTYEVISCAPEDSLSDAERRMAANRRSRIMVIDDCSRLVGVISLSDVAENDSNSHAGAILRRIVAREYRY
jgi:CBS-domain-containing membrane protein